MSAFHQTFPARTTRRRQFSRRTPVTPLKTTRNLAPSRRTGDLVVERFRNFFSIFDGRREVNSRLLVELGHAMYVLFNESVVDEQLAVAQELLAQKVTIEIRDIVRCSTGRIFYHIKLTAPDEPGTARHITGFATINRKGKVIKEETKESVVRLRDIGIIF